MSEPDGPSPNLHFELSLALHQAVADKLDQQDGRSGASHAQRVARARRRQDCSPNKAALGVFRVTREQLEHIIRAACAVANDDELVVIGSQSVLGQYPVAPSELTQSLEAGILRCYGHA